MRHRSAFITGAASGIGKSLAEKLLRDGVNVFAVDINAKGLESLQTWADEHEFSLEIFESDICDSVKMKKIVQEIEQNRVRIDLWINCAAVGGIGSFDEVSEEDYTKLIQINLMSVIDNTRIAIKHMQRNGFGKIVNLSSVSGFLPAPLMTNYSLCKHAIVGFTRALQMELKMNSSPIDLVLVAPGFVDTAIINKGGEHGFPQWMSPILAKPESVADEILTGLRKGKLEIFPTWNGKLMMMIQKLSPHIMGRHSKLLLKKSLKDVIFNLN